MQYPLINGVRRDFSSIELFIASVPFIGFKAIDYNDGLEPGVVMGASAMPIGVTRGQYKAEASITMYRSEFDLLVANLAAQGATSLPLPKGYMEVFFDISVSYADDADTKVSKDEIVGCRIKKVNNSHSQGSDALEVKLDLHVHHITRNGVSPVSDSAQAKAAAGA